MPGTLGAGGGDNIISESGVRGAVLTVDGARQSAEAVGQTEYMSVVCRNLTPHDYPDY